MTDTRGQVSLLLVATVALSLVVSAALGAGLSMTGSTNDLNLNANGNVDSEVPEDLPVMIEPRTVDPDTMFDEAGFVRMTIVFDITDLSNDGAEDVVTVTFSDAFGDGISVTDIIGPTATFTDANGNVIPQTAAPVISDATGTPPSGQVVTLRIAPDASFDTSRITVSVELSPFPSTKVGNALVVPIEGTVVDSDGDTDTETLGEVTLEPGFPS